MAATTVSGNDDIMFNGTIGLFQANSSDDMVVCYAPSMITTNGVWRGENPLDYAMPLFILQIILIILTTRILVLILKPFRQPKVISEILGGVILGPSVLGRIMKFGDVMFPLRSIMVLETMANVGLLYFLFLIGVEMDITVIKRSGRKVIFIALVGMAFPFVIASAMSFLLHDNNTGISRASFLLFMGVAVSVTAFPVLARILVDLKLLNSEIGKIAMSAAVINDMGAWILLAVAIALAENRSSPLPSIFMVTSATVFVLFCIFVIRPGISWIISQTPEGENYSDFHICIILTLVMICSFTTDAIGIHSVFGAFVFGLVIPNGPLGNTLIDKLEDFISALLLPLFFAVNGIRTDVNKIANGQNAVYLLIMIILASAAKVFGTVVVAVMHEMQVREGFALGLLMNTRGLVELIVLNVGRDQKVLNDQEFTILVLMTVVITAVITPAIIAIYKPARSFIPYKRRTIQRSRADAELRVLVCVHTPRNVPTIVNLLEASNPTMRSPICAYVLHLVELAGRASTMLIVHGSHKSTDTTTNRTQAQSDHIFNAFENFAQHAENVIVQPLTAISPYSTMHEDICCLAEDKRVAFIIIPFHKQQSVDGGMVATNPALRTVNQNLLANAPCSVGVLIDRGLGNPAKVAATHVSHQIAVLYFGGPDDREALAYAWRMAELPGINLTVLRFIPSKDAAPLPVDPNDEGILTVDTSNDREKQFDDEYINEFRMKIAGDESIEYIEKVLRNGEETVAAIRSMDPIHDLYIVGRGQGFVSPLTAGLTDWSECPELGAIGDVLASSDFAATVSVLVVQQYVGTGLQDGITTPNNADAIMKQSSFQMPFKGADDAHESNWNS
ncbi:hypothetical protein Scep_007237 [Stephania cephalantha]|uniref:Cation/H+ exchanger domain-containing protein n=1 Tax=Stephania cephalantha TaxID=152367 RepID=A0AAP0PNM8_9MAGN